MDQYGLYPILLVAAFLGSQVYIAAQDGPPTSLWAIYSPIVSGTLTGNYFAHLAVVYMLGETAAAAWPGAIGAFGVGVCGPWAARWLFKKVQARVQNGNGKPSHE